MTEPSGVVIERDVCRASERLARAARRLLAETARDCAAAEATFWLISADGQHMEGVFNHGPTPEILETAAVPVADSVVGMVAANGLAASIGPEDPHNPAVDRMTGTVTRAMVAAPVRVRGQTCGVISAINPQRGGVFSGEALDTLKWKAWLLGLVLAELLPA